MRLKGKYELEKNKNYCTLLFYFTNFVLYVYSIRNFCCMSSLHRDIGFISNFCSECL